MCAYQRVRNVSFSEKFAYVFNGWPLRAFLKIKIRIAFILKFKFITEACLEPILSTMKLFCESSQKLKAVNCFHKNAPS